MAYTEKQTIRNLYKYLKDSREKEIIVRTSYVKDGQGWHDHEFDANAAGFHIQRYINPEYEARREFSECYRLTRKELR